MTHQARRLMTAADLSDKHLGQSVCVGSITGTLTGIIGIRDRVTLAVLVGGSRAWFPLEGGAEVEVWRP